METSQISIARKNIRRERDLRHLSSSICLHFGNIATDKLELPDELKNLYNHLIIKHSNPEKFFDLEGSEEKEKEEIAFLTVITILGIYEKMFGHQKYHNQHSHAQ